jgi:outer membrane protein assembly factor BamB
MTLHSWRLPALFSSVCLARAAALSVLCLFAVAPVAAAQEWARFRGVNGAGVSDLEIPATWTEADYNWRVELPGIGHSSPVLWGDKIFLTSAVEESAERIAMCVSATDGKILWQKHYPSKVHAKHLRNSFASPTPAVDDRQAYFSWSSPEEYTLLALDHEGNEKWRRNLGPYVSQHSAGPSPMIYGDNVILGNDQDGDSSLVAVDRATGNIQWQTPRTSEAVSYATPCVLKRAGQPEELIFLSGAHGVSGVDPKSGKTNWELDVFDKRTCASPVLVNGLILGSCGSGAGGNYVAAVRPGSVDGATPPSEAWRITDSAPYVPTIVAKGDLAFLWSDKGVVMCVKATQEAGKVLWKQRVGGNFSGSPIIVGDKVMAIAEDGEVVVLAAAEEYKLLAKNPLGEDSRSTPSVAGGKLYLRTYKHLISLGGKK